MPNTQHPPTNYRYGLVRGTRNVPALPAALPLGLLVSAVLACVNLAVTSDGSSPWLSTLVWGMAVTPAATALAWVALVDRGSLPGAVAKPEEAVESTWYASAASDAFHILLAATGLGAYMAMFWHRPTIALTLSAVFGAAALTFGISYTVRKAR
ncbi:hypothetical protein [Corynebacterium heidelbergense]|uniref:Uncharacterized protein n=1 Tax=Corynebacterium heidelbergense TaxID=2055947 RepID=A0A364VDN5_9CORY|nr:hypothetical protein [Corynebacterium heidelbergense]RAV34728.1 hypothetical protein CWC39_01875 [Corynebacterium heidelbergense]WCZ37336.1 hypothetical protein CHEID_09030 [Corynebacterium heidelbergense]